MADQPTLDHDFEFEIDLTGVRAPTGKSVSMDEGYYKGTVDDMYINQDKPGRFVIQLKVKDDPYVGNICSTGINVPTGNDDKVRFYWRALAESVGFTASELDKGTVKLSPKVFKGKTAHFYYAPDPEGGKKITVHFFSPVEWAQQKQVFEATRNIRKPPVEEEDNNKDASNTTTKKADLLKQLGI